MDDLGVEIVRLPYSWHNIQGTQGAGVQISSMINELKQARDRGMKTIIQIGQSPCWAIEATSTPCNGQSVSTVPPANAGDYGDMLNKVVNAIVDVDDVSPGHLATIIGWEVWNEVNSPNFWGYDEDAANGEHGRGSSSAVCSPELTDTESGQNCEVSFVPEYLPLLRAAHKALHDVYSEQQVGYEPVVMATGMAGTDVAYLKEMYRVIGDSSLRAQYNLDSANSDDYFDALSVHPVGQDIAGNDASPVTRSHVYNSFEWGIETLLNVMDQNSDSEKQMYFTEFTWAAYPSAAPNERRGVSEQSQAYYLAQSLDLIESNDWSDRIAAACWYELEDSKGDTEARFGFQGLHSGPGEPEPGAPKDPIDDTERRLVATVFEDYTTSFNTFDLNNYSNWKPRDDLLQFLPALVSKSN